MDITFSRFQYVYNDQIHRNSCFSCDIRDRKFFFLEKIRFCRRKIPVYTKCFSVEQTLQPKPKPKPVPKNFELETALEENHINKPLSGICEQIEKLVFFKNYDEALELFEIVEHGEEIVGSSTYDSLVNACIGLRSIRGVKRVFHYMIQSGFEPDQYLLNRTLLMHVKCELMLDARQLFDEMPERNMVSWNIMIAGLVDSGDHREAFSLFLRMWQEFSDAGSRTFATTIRACAGLGLVSAGRQLHSCVIKMELDGDIFISCALIDMYSKCGSIEDAHLVFEEMPAKTVVGWNSIIAGYALHGYSEQALDLYYEMKNYGVKMDHFTYSIIVRICARLASLEHAKQAHAGLVRNGFGSDTVANTALVDFYSKWGRIEDARRVFSKMPRKNIISWNALIAGYGNHGRGKEAIELFEQMLQEGFNPNHITFLAVLSACSYSGLSDQGREYFELMSQEFKIKPRAMHYACMVELLGREGLLDEAFALIRDAPFTPTENMWAALLTACRIQKNLELGKFAAERLYGMEPEKLSNYIVLMNIYSDSGMSDEAAKVRETLMRRGLRLLPACSWIEVKKQPHGFLFGDKSHAQSDEIYRKLDELTTEMAKHGYVPNARSLLPDIQEQEECQSVSYHSEKLAISFGLISTPDFTSLQIVQSHRVCCDCHTIIKLIAMVTQRELVVRDASRFHHFKNGRCSCGDYW